MEQIIDIIEKISGPLVIKGGFEKIIQFNDFLAKLDLVKPSWR